MDFKYCLLLTIMASPLMAMDKNFDEIEERITHQKKSEIAGKRKIKEISDEEENQNTSKKIKIEETQVNVNEELNNKIGNALELWDRSSKTQDQEQALAVFIEAINSNANIDSYIGKIICQTYNSKRQVAQKWVKKNAQVLKDYYLKIIEDKEKPSSLRSKIAYYLQSSCPEVGRLLRDLVIDSNKGLTLYERCKIAYDNYNVFKNKNDSELDKIIEFYVESAKDENLSTEDRLYVIDYFFSVREVNRKNKEVRTILGEFVDNKELTYAHRLKAAGLLCKGANKKEKERVSQLAQTILEDTKSSKINNIKVKAVDILLQSGNDEQKLIASKECIKIIKDSESDQETLISAIELFLGYKPKQDAVFYESIVSLLKSPDLKLPAKQRFALMDSLLRTKDLRYKDVICENAFKVLQAAEEQDIHEKIDSAGYLVSHAETKEYIDLALSSLLQVTKDICEESKDTGSYDSKVCTKLISSLEGVVAKNKEFGWSLLELMVLSPLSDYDRAYAMSYLLQDPTYIAQKRKESLAKDNLSKLEALLVSTAPYIKQVSNLFNEKSLLGLMQLLMVSSKEEHKNDALKIFETLLQRYFFLNNQGAASYFIEPNNYIPSKFQNALRAKFIKANYKNTLLKDRLQAAFYLNHSNNEEEKKVAQEYYENTWKALNEKVEKKMAFLEDEFSVIEALICSNDEGNLKKVATLLLTCPNYNQVARITELMIKHKVHANDKIIEEVFTSLKAYLNNENIDIKTVVGYERFLLHTNKYFKYATGLTIKALSVLKLSAIQQSNILTYLLRVLENKHCDYFEEIYDKILKKGIIENSKNPLILRTTCALCYLVKGEKYQGLRETLFSFLQNDEVKEDEELATYLAKMIIHRIGHLNQEDSLYQAALDILLKNVTNQKSPFHIHKLLLEKRKEEIDWRKIPFNPEWFKDLEINVTFKDLPTVSYKDFEDAVLKLEQALKDEKLQKVFDEMVEQADGKKKDPVAYRNDMVNKLKGNYFKDLLSVQSTTPSLSYIHLSFLTDYLKNLSSQAEEGLSDQAKFLFQIGFNAIQCETGISKSLRLSYNALPKKYQLKIQQATNNGDSNQTEELKQELNSLLRDFIESIMEGSSEFTRKLTQTPKDQQFVTLDPHQEVYLKNLIGPEIGLQAKPIFDMYGNEENVNAELLSLKKSEALKIFFDDFFREDIVIKKVQELLTQKLNTKGSYNAVASLLPKNEEHNYIALPDFDEDAEDSQEKITINAEGVKIVLKKLGIIK